MGAAAPGPDRPPALGHGQGNATLAGSAVGSQVIFAVSDSWSARRAGITHSEVVFPKKVLNSARDAHSPPRGSHQPHLHSGACRCPNKELEKQTNKQTKFLYPFPVGHRPGNESGKTTCPSAPRSAWVTTSSLLSSPAHSTIYSDRARRRVAARPRALPRPALKASNLNRSVPSRRGLHGAVSEASRDSVEPRGQRLPPAGEREDFDSLFPPPSPRRAEHAKTRVSRSARERTAGTSSSPNHEQPRVTATAKLRSRRRGSLSETQS